MPRMIAALTLATALGAIVLLGMSGCTAGPAPSSTGGTGSSQTDDSPGDEGQSTTDACALVQDTIAEATAEFETSAVENPAAVVEAMRAASEKLSGAASRITNDDVAALVPSLPEMFAQAGEVMEAVAAGDASKLQDLTELGEDFQQTSEAFQELCASP